MLCWRRISAIGTPASPCFRISTIWLSVNRDFRMGISLAPESLRSKCLLKGEAYGRSNLELRSEGDPYPRPRSQPAAPGFPWQALKCRGPGSQTRSCAGVCLSWAQIWAQTQPREDFGVDNVLETMVGRDGIEPPTPGFSVLCSTN